MPSKDIYTIRRENTRAAANNCNSDLEFAQKIDRPSSLVSNWIGSRKTQHKNIGHNAARHIELMLNKESGWLDIEHIPSSNLSDDDKTKILSLYAKLDDKQKEMLELLLVTIDLAGGDIDKVIQRLKNQDIFKQS